MKVLRYGLGLLLTAVWLVPLPAQQTTGTVRGRVTDESSQLPLQGATVRAGSQSGTTRADGGYQLTGVPDGTDSLRVTMIGYAPVARAITVAAGETVDMDVGLAPQATELAELVVVGYGEQRQGNVTGALTNVTSQEFNKGRVVTPTELIQNKVAGVQVVENTEPGGKTSIRIRGGTSTSASNEPLYVVDGQPLGTDAGGGVTSGRDPLNFINPEDIASMTVLRDAGAAAIYGTNAANGVVLITTKRGQAGQPMKIEYTGSVSASTVTRVPSMLNAQQFRSVVEQFAPANAAQLQNENTDWFGAIDRTGFGQEHNVAVSGGAKSMDYRVSLNFLDQRGIINANSARRFGLGLNYNQRLADDRLNLRFSVRGSRTDDRFTPLGVLSAAAQYGPTQPITDPASPTGFYEWPGNNSTSADNPVAILDLAEEKAETYRAIGNLQTEYRLPWVDGLRANVTLGFDASDGVRRNFRPSVLHREQVDGRGGQQTRYNPQQTSTVLETYLAYTTPRPLGPGTLDLTGGYSWTKTHIDSIYYEGNGLSSDAGGTDQIVRAATTHEHRVRTAEQADLVLRPVQLQHQRQVHPRRHPSARRLIAVRGGERLRHLPVRVRRVAAFPGAVPAGGRWAVGSQAAGHPGRRPAISRSATTWRTPPISWATTRVPISSATPSSRPAAPVPWTRTSSGSRPGQSTSASTSDSRISGSPARSTSTTS